MDSYLRGMLLSLSGNITACMTITLFPLNHIIKHWCPVLNDALSCLILCDREHYGSSKGDRIVVEVVSASSLLPLPRFPSSRHPLASFTRHIDEEISPALASHLKSCMHLKCTAVWNASIISLTCLKPIGYIFRTWYPPEQNTTAFHYKPDEKKSNSNHKFNNISTHVQSESIIAGV